MDTTLDGRPDHPRGWDHPAPAGKRRAPRRRCSGAPRPRVHPGSHGHPGAVRHVAGIPTAASRRPRPRDPGAVPREREELSEPPRRGSRRAVEGGRAPGRVGRHAQVHRQPPQGLVRRGRHPRERLWVRVAAQARRGPLRDELLHEDASGPHPRNLPHGTEPSGGRSECPAASRRHAAARLAGGPRLLRDRERQLLVRGPGRGGSENGSDRDLLPAGRLGDREERLVHEHRTHAAVA